MKRIAVITGASSGMGRQFVLTLDRFGQFDEVWVIARRKERLEELKALAPCSVRPVAMDLTDPASFEAYEALLSEEKPEVGLLVNASGFGKFDAVMDTPLYENLNMADLNCRAVMALCQLTIPYMCEGGQIINIASVAAFQPIPYIDVYAATKAFVLSYSRALNRELDRIHVMALCPFWTKTEFFDRAVSSRNVVKKYIAMYRPEDVVDRAWRDAKRHKEVCMYGFKARGQALLVKILPHSLVMRIWMKQQDLHAQ
ncbi:MAG: SDR family NAD(P)-dependent oxidoreductase [Lachnospiraceae bacterium]|nr:SDR family NAD(P)-dependent oxidoreductase [Lachnospiraceae bacterium]